MGTKSHFCRVMTIWPFLGHVSSYQRWTVRGRFPSWPLEAWLLDLGRPCALDLAGHLRWIRMSGCLCSNQATISPPFRSHRYPLASPSLTSCSRVMQALTALQYLTADCSYLVRLFEPAVPCLYSGHHEPPGQQRTVAVSS